MTNTPNLEDLLGATRGEAIEEEGPFFASHGLLENPFPPSRTIISQILFDQEAAFEKFGEVVKEVLREQPTRRAMALLAGTGGGKTHFLRHCRWQLQEYCKKYGRSFVLLEFQAGSGSVQDILREAFRATDELCRQSRESDLPTTILRGLQDRADATNLLDRVKQQDLKSALIRLRKASAPDYQPPDRYREYDFDRLRELFNRWFVGGVLNPTERKYLGVLSRIGTASVGTRVLRDTLMLARSLRIVEGILLCLDEVETLFRGGMRLAQTQAWLQDLRFLYDEAVKDGEGLSLMVISASTPAGALNLSDTNYPLYQRLGFEGNTRVQLQPISDLDDATNFAHTYVKYGHERWREKYKDQRPQRDPLDLLSKEELESAFQKALGAKEVFSRTGGNANQAPLLEELHNLVEQKRRGWPGGC